MDVETVHMIAPAAKILYYQSTFEGTGFADAYQRIRAEGKASIVTVSVGQCSDGSETGDTLRVLKAERDAIAKLRSAKITVFASSSDHGLYTCIGGGWSGEDTDWSAMPDWPAYSPDVVSVGGTFLQHGAGKSYGAEHAWSSSLTNWATGGGISPNDDQPSWQAGIGVHNASSNGKRQYPDVAAPGDPQSGWTIVVHGQDDRSSGTSAAAPFWAGNAALVRQAAQNAHVGTFPFLAPVLYAVANAARPNTVFHDVVGGSDLRDAATLGWDYATGLGSPIGTPLADAIVAYLKAHPTSS